MSPRQLQKKLMQVEPQIAAHEMILVELYALKSRTLEAK